MVKYLLLGLLIFICASLCVNIIGPEVILAHPLNQKGPLFFQFVIFPGVLLPGTIALAVVYLASVEEKPSKEVAAANAWFARQTYDVYLFHPLVLMILFAVFPPSTWFYTGDSSSATMFLAFGALTLTLSILGGYLQRALCSACMAQLSALANVTYAAFAPSSSLTHENHSPWSIVHHILQLQCVACKNQKILGLFIRPWWSQIFLFLLILGLFISINVHYCAQYCSHFQKRDPVEVGLLWLFSCSSIFRGCCRRCRYTSHTVYKPYIHACYSAMCCATHEGSNLDADFVEPDRVCGHSFHALQFFHDYSSLQISNLCLGSNWQGRCCLSMTYVEMATTALARWHNCFAWQQPCTNF